ncbi:hypothetical protein [Lunatibacter salilacus]|uniref:hypothetical protein n=1 Tax=Lunatibacter salilacus TaxID=2483804 RepID=UPI00131AE942|nr:hypothetical protein [Lunatibacter salilacus]
MVLTPINGEVFFAIIDEEEQSLQKVILEGFERANEFIVTYRVGAGATVSPQNTEIVRLGNKLIITNPTFSRIAVYDLETKPELLRLPTIADCK